jgi:benzoyl-CoA 2,3-dioxygenase component B
LKKPLPSAATPFVEVNYDDRIPNNVDLSSDKQLQRALETWQPNYVDWWKEMGPEGFQEAEVYLRTAVGVDPSGWAKFGHVKMPEYRWGILLAPKEEGRVIPCGRHKGQPAWQEVPGEYRSLLRRLIVVQGDTEPASVEQQRFLGATAPSLYDMRNLFQVNVEEGRHLWAMVYLLVKYFGKDGREEAQALLERRSGHQDNPRILGAFNERTPDWLSFFMFTYFTDRDGKMQLAALAQSGFDPLSRSCRFMLTEEAHHLFVGETGVGRTIEATCNAMKAAGITDPYDKAAIRKLGVVDLPTLQKKANFHMSVTRDLFGSEISSNGAEAFSSGLKGRFNESGLKDDHQLENATYPVTARGGRPARDRRSARAALHQQPPAGRLHRRLPGRHRPLEQGDREGRHQLPVHPAAQGLQPQDRRVRPRAREPGWRDPERRGLAGRAGRLAVQRRRLRPHQLVDEALLRSGPVRQLDCAAPRGHQQPAPGLRVRAHRTFLKRIAGIGMACCTIASHADPSPNRSGRPADRPAGHPLVRADLSGRLWPVPVARPSPAAP